MRARRLLDAALQGVGQVHLAWAPQIERLDAFPLECIITLAPGRTPGVPEDVVVHDAAAWLLGNHACE